MQRPPRSGLVQTGIPPVIFRALNEREYPPMHSLIQDWSRIACVYRHRAAHYLPMVSGRPR
jgi:hypothetical protein